MRRLVKLNYAANFFSVAYIVTENSENEMAIAQLDDMSAPPH
jgi:hypothetical protein